MPRNSGRFAIAIVLFALIGVSGCSGSSQAVAPTTTTTDPRPTTVAQQPSATPETLAARVNDQGIALLTLDREVTRRIEANRSFGNPPPADLNAFRNEVLNSLIEQLLIEQAAAIQGVVVSDADLNAEIQSLIELSGGEANWRAQLEQDRLTEDEYRANLRSALVTAKMRDIVTASACKNVEQANARHILVSDRARAEQIKVDLENGGDFAALALQYSLDVTTNQSGGDLGWFARGQLLQPEIEAAAFGQALNVYSDPIQTELGYHIVQVLGRANDRPIDEDTCYTLTEISFRRWIEELVSKAKIEKFI
ncbi:MAG: peptidylprolyl isomerase [Anaerolineae bacterium]